MKLWKSIRLQSRSAALLLFAAALSGCSLPGMQPAQPTAGATAPVQTVLPTQPPQPTLTQPAPPNPDGPASQLTAQPALTSAPAATAAATQAGATNVEYGVVLVFEGDALNVRSSPSAAATLLETLPANATGIQSTGRSEMVGDQRWVEIKRTGGTGWVNAYFLTEQVPADQFCADARVTTLLENLRRAVAEQDGPGLAALVSPVHGLNLQYLRGGTTAAYSPEEAQWVFSSTYETDWGAHPGSGEPVKATFSSEVLPRLQEVLAANPAPACNTIAVGGTTYTAEWPEEYANFQFVSLYKPGTPGTDLDWRTWLAGIEYVGGEPYLFALNHLQWEP